MRAKNKTTEHSEGQTCRVYARGCLSGFEECCEKKKIPFRLVLQRTLCFCRQMICRRNRILILKEKSSSFARHVNHVVGLGVKFCSGNRILLFSLVLILDLHHSLSDDAYPADHHQVT